MLIYRSNSKKVIFEIHSRAKTDWMTQFEGHPSELNGVEIERMKGVDLWIMKPRGFAINSQDKDMRTAIEWLRKWGRANGREHDVLLWPDGAVIFHEGDNRYEMYPRTNQ